MAIDKIDSFDHGVLSAAGTGLYGSITGASPQIEIVTTRPRTGTRSLKLAPNGATIFASYNNAGASFGGTQRAGRVFFNMDAVPTTGAFAISILNALGGRWRVLFDSFSPMQIAAACEGGTSQVAGTTFALDTWHYIDFSYNVAGATHTCDWKVNGVDQTQCTFGSSATTISTAELRYEGTATDGTCFFDDVVLTNANADFPLDIDTVRYVSPDSVGTHSVDAATSSFFFKDIGGSETALGNSGDTTSYQQIDDVAMDADTDHVLVRPVVGTFPTIPTTGANRVLFQLATAPAGTHTSPSLTTLANNNGDLLIAIVIIYDGNSTNAEFSSWGGGFTEFTDQAGTATMGIGCAYKFSDGTETGTFTVTSADTSNNDSCFILLSIPNAHPSTPPEAGTMATGTSPNSGSLDPAGWGSEDTLWIAVGGSGEDSLTGSFTGIGTAPTNYGNQANSGISADAIGGIEGSVAFRQLIAASEDPGTWSMDASNARGCSLLIAVRPASPSSFPTTSHYLEYGVADSAATGTIRAVRGIVRQRQDTASADTIAAKLHADGADGNIFSGTINTATDEYKTAVFTQTPNSTAWTDAFVDGMTLRWGYTADCDTTPRLVAAGFEFAATADVAAGAIPTALYDRRTPRRRIHNRM